MEFLSSVDIANRALQHVGASRIDPVLGFTEDSKNASETSFAYGKLREAELRRNTWRFATRRVVIRPVDPTTMFLNPPLWASTTTYYPGAIVSDAANTLWSSTASDNLNNAPGNSQAWEEYFGPLSVHPLDPSGKTDYSAGELVYIAPGDGTYNVYRSLVSSNSEDPSVADEWLQASIYNKDSVVQFIPPWLIGTTYAKGAITAFNSLEYTSLVDGNIGKEPDQNASVWALKPLDPGPQQWQPTITYPLGAYVLFLGSTYVSIQAANLNTTPLNTAWWVLKAGAQKYLSLIQLNQNNEPDLAPALWATGTTYAIGNKVGASNGLIYTSATNGNLGHDPTLDVAGTNWTNTNVLNPWTTVFSGQAGSAQWTQVPVSLTTIVFAYPLGTGPSFQSATKNIYRLPAGYLKMAPQDPKAGSTGFLGAPSGLMYKDWLIESDYIVTREVFPLMIRFIANITWVPSMDPMFCEGLAGRIGMEVCEILTQSTNKVQVCTNAYSRAMSEARTVNGIETGAEEAPEDNYITCRI